MDSCFDNIDRIAAPDYIPSDDDILRLDVETNQTLELTYEKTMYRERLLRTGFEDMIHTRVHRFTEIDFEQAKQEPRPDVITALMFCVDLSAYDQDPSSATSIQAAVALFESISNHAWHSSRGVYVRLMLNKEDVLDEKLAQGPLSRYPADYKDGNGIFKARKFIYRQFVSVAQQRATVHMWPEATCATNSRRTRLSLRLCCSKYQLSPQPPVDDDC